METKPKRIRKHKPNFIARKTRVICAITAVLLLCYIAAHLAIGYIYLPTKRGGVLLSGMPALAIMASIFFLSLPATLTIIDHYDKRPNEKTYKSLKTACLRISLYFFRG